MERLRAIEMAQARSVTATIFRRNWRNHVAARQSANWHRDWDRGRDHWWNGHHCRFINGSWVIFDFGFYPWWPYWYPYDYYPYDYYPYSYSYDPGYYDSGVDQGEEYYDQNGYDSSDQKHRLNHCRGSGAISETRLLPGRNRQRPRPETRRAIARIKAIMACS